MQLGQLLLSSKFPRLRGESSISLKTQSWIQKPEAKHGFLKELMISFGSRNCLGFQLIIFSGLYLVTRNPQVRGHISPLCSRRDIHGLKTAPVWSRAPTGCRWVLLLCSAFVCACTCVKEPDTQWPHCLEKREWHFSGQAAPPWILLRDYCSFQSK